MPTLVGTAAADQLRGDTGDDSISGLDGPDTLNGLAGADTLDGGAGNDSLIDWTGNDLLLGGAGDDVITADHRFSDSATTQSATLNGGDGDDVIYAYARYGLFFTVPANLETFSASILGGAGNDHIEARGDFASTIDAGAGDDTVVVGQTIAQPTLLTLGPGADSVMYEPRLIWNTSVLTITDFQPGDGGDHLISPFDSTDLLSNWDHTANPFNDGHLHLIQRGADTVLQIDRDAAGTSFTFQDMVIFRNTQSSAFTAFNTMGYAPSGSSVGPGTPTAGDDSLTATPAATEIHAGAGADTIVGTSVNDYLRGDDGDDSIAGGSAFDDINGNMGNDTAHGNAGDDWVVGGKDNDQLFGDAGDDIVWGNLGNDTLDGGDGNDQVRGGQGDDVVNGGAGNDFVSGDRGNDTVTGGAGADLFHDSQDAGIDRVLDFHLSEGDKVMLDPGTTFSVSQVGADTVIDMGGGNQMILVGVQMSSLPAGTIFLG
jgi:Ca2+-binding RTX toxin-like protein